MHDDPDVHLHFHIGGTVDTTRLDELLRLARQERMRDRDLAQQIGEIAEAVTEPGDTATKLRALATRLRGMASDTTSASSEAQPT